VHLLVAVHVAHWLRTGSTLSPLEPSEAMEFFKHDVVNAGFVFFALTILSTLVLGRWFCGWGCHLVALQDLCRWLLLRVGIRPRPLRSRLLVLVPLIAAVYMFLYPLAYRLWVGDPVLQTRWALTKADFWQTFPPWHVAAFTFAVCGFVTVYFLGAKGFCTYACPYGAVFGLADKLAVGRIRVTDACEGCGHCTAVCSSNVRVHAEVRDYGMVVDPGCMKCFDCVSVCPKDALYFGFGRPSLGARPRREPEARRPALGWGEEALLGAAFVATFLVVRGLYGLVPFLLALGLAGVLAPLYLALWSFVRKADVTLASWRLKRGGRATPGGRVYLAGMALCTLALGHSALVQMHARSASESLAALVDAGERALADPGYRSDPAERERVEQALADARFVDRYGLRTTPDIEAGLAWLALLDGRPEEFEARWTDAARRAGAEPGLHLRLARFYEARGRLEEAVERYERYLALDPDPTAFDTLGRLLWRSGREEAALVVYERAVLAHPESPDLHYNRGVALAMLGRAAGAIAAFERTLELDAERVDARENLAGLYCGAGRFAEGIAQYRAALERSPDDASTLELLVRAHLAAGDPGGARADLERRLVARPDDAAARALLERLGPR